MSIHESYTLFHTVVYENSSQDSEIGHGRIKLSVTERLYNYFSLIKIQAVRSCKSNPNPISKLGYNMCVCLSDNNIPI